MKFGEQLKVSLIKDYAYYYMNYDDLKHELAKNLVLNDNGWNGAAEEKFVGLLDAELDKVYTFQKVKSNELNRRIKQADKDVKAVLHAAESTPQSVEEIDFEDLEEMLSSIIADVHDLAKFSQLNYTGFQKIIKKHDKVTHWNLKPIFTGHMNSKPFFKENFDLLIVQLSKLYDLTRTRGHPFSGDSSAGGTQQNFVRQTTKYWVHPDNITELKLIILKHLPVLVFNPNKEFESEDNCITSIYYDNSHMDLYRGRLEKSEGAEAIRLRWYGGMKSDTIFLERKTHREDWTGEKSVKARVSLKEKHVNDFMAGRYTVEEAFAKARREGKKSPKELENLERLAGEIQFRVIHDRLRPVMRSFYNRTAFQLPGDARVRISLDTELTMVREDNFDGLDRAHNNWRRMDIGVDYPFPQLPEGDAERFPYAVLEVKLQTQLGQEPPQWIRDLVSSHLVEAVPKFSKFIHGCATLLPNKVDLIPFWLPQMGVDIRKQPNSQYGINSDSQGQGLVHFAEPQNAQNATETSPLLGSTVSNTMVVPLWQRIVRKICDIMGYDVRIAKDPEGTEYVTDLKVPKGKRICVPVRVEPKVYFANERTFLSWIEIGILLGAMAATLLNYGNKLAKQAALMFFFVAVGTITYSIGIYIYRLRAIRERKAIRYDDPYGPAVICVSLAAAVGTDFAMQYFRG